MNNAELLTHIKAILEDKAAEKIKCGCPTCEAFCTLVRNATECFGSDAVELVVYPYYVLSRTMAFVKVIDAISEGLAAQVIESTEKQTTATKH